MSDQYVLSRRKAITLFGISATSMGATIAQSNSSSTRASTGEFDDMAASARVQLTTRERTENREAIEYFGWLSGIQALPSAD